MKLRFRNYLGVFFLIVLATLAGIVVNALVVHLDPANLVMFYLLVVVIVAYQLGNESAIVTAIISVVVFNFFFVPPEFTLRVANAQYLITFFGLLVVGVVIANLTADAKQQADAAQQREYETAQLYALSRQLLTIVELDSLVKEVFQHAQKTFKCDVAVYLPDGDKLMPQYVSSPKFDLVEQETALWAFQNNRTAGCGTAYQTHAKACYLPLRTAHETLGVLGCFIDETPLSPEKRRLMKAFAAQAALAIEAVQLGQEVQQAKLLGEKEKLQTALLNSISHDLRTPLVSITGTLGSLRENEAFFDAAARRDLLDGAYHEAERLNRLVSNLLDMSRLEAGSLKLKRELYDVQEIIGVARSQMRERLQQHLIEIDLPEDLPLVPVDLVLFTQVMVNLLDNAVKYSEVGMPITIFAKQDDDFMVIGIADRGIGIPEKEHPYIFKKFYRAVHTTGYGGSGLGLSICQGIVEAHNGTIYAERRIGGGTCFIIRLPLI